MKVICPPDGLEIWARLASKYVGTREQERDYWRSVTELIRPPKAVALELAHRDELTIDLIYLLKSIEGTALHEALMSVAKDNELVHTRIKTEFCGKIISGEPDLVVIEPDGCIVVDFKRIKAVSLLYSKPDYEAQLNMYAWLIQRELKLKVKALRLEVRVSDWSEIEARRDSRYPDSPLLVVPVDIWPYAKTEEFVESRIRYHEAVEKELQEGNTEPRCNDEERWARGGYWCLVNAKGRALPRAKFNTEQEAKAAQEVRGGTLQYRPAKSMRCSPHGDYSGCLARFWCTQYQMEIEPDEFMEE
ncbi:MAG: PD-(D/E)XK nuclease family protein [Candidatus Hadarchaeum sp.]